MTHTRTAGQGLQCAVQPGQGEFHASGRSERFQTQIANLASVLGATPPVAPDIRNRMLPLGRRAPCLRSPAEPPGSPPSPSGTPYTRRKPLSAPAPPRSANISTLRRVRAICTALLGAIGEVLSVDDEALIDPVTAVSGSGPAYVFLLIECLAEAGVEAGLPRDLADRLALVTVAGASQLALRGEDAPAQLRKNVTSPGGTTQAALEVLMSGEGLQQLMTRAVAAATKRGQELAGFPFVDDFLLQGRQFPWRASDRFLPFWPRFWIAAFSSAISASNASEVAISSSAGWPLRRSKWRWRKPPPHPSLCRYLAGGASVGPRPDCRAVSGLGLRPVRPWAPG